MSIQSVGITQKPVVMQKNLKPVKEAEKNIEKQKDQTQRATYLFEEQEEYVPSSEANGKKAEYAQTVERLKAESEAKFSQLKVLVEKMLLKQGEKMISTDEMWEAFANEAFVVDEETALKAKEEIAEDGYWGVEKTSQRIFDFATALSGGNEEQMEKMKKAVEQGFKEATKAWGKDLPSISSQTYDAVMQKFDDFFNQEAISEET